MWLCELVRDSVLIIFIQIHELYSYLHFFVLTYCQKACNKYAYANTLTNIRCRNEQIGFTCKTVFWPAMRLAKDSLPQEKKLFTLESLEWRIGIPLAQSLFPGAQKAHPLWSCRRWTLASFGDHCIKLPGFSGADWMWTNKLPGAIIWKDLDDYQPKWLKHTLDGCELLIFLVTPSGRVQSPLRGNSMI